MTIAQDLQVICRDLKTSVSRDLSGRRATHRYWIAYIVVFGGDVYTLEWLTGLKNYHEHRFSSFSRAAPCAYPTAASKNKADESFIIWDSGSMSFSTQDSPVYIHTIWR